MSGRSGAQARSDRGSGSRRPTPLPAPDWDDAAREALSPLLPPERANPRDAGNVLSTMVRHPALTRAYLTFNAYVLRDSTLSPRVREVALLRVVLRRDCPYLWDHHVPIAQRAGLTLDDIDGIRDGGLDAGDRLLVRAVDELDGDNRISDATWAELGEVFDERQCMDLVFAVGAYALLAVAVNTFGIEDEAH